MLCDECLKNTATVHLTTFVNGQVKTVHLCGQCAAKRKRSASSPGFSFNDFMSAFYDEAEAEQNVCSKCGTTLDSFKKTGRLGCADCYKVFESSLLPVLRGIHMNVKHTGKHPGERVPVEMKPSAGTNEKEQLKRKLREAVAVENFEEAARLRDQIALLEKEEK
jgi:protein arginine kinase activator